MNCPFDLKFDSDDSIRKTLFVEISWNFIMIIKKVKSFENCIV